MQNRAPLMIEVGNGPVDPLAVEEVIEVALAAIQTTFAGRRMDSRALASGLVFLALDVLSASGSDIDDARDSLLRLITETSIESGDGDPAFLN